jgi:Co/Zn/Cd efflux system component
LSLMIETKVWRSSLGVQSSPMPAAVVMERKARRTLPAASGFPFLVQKTRSYSVLLDTIADAAAAAGVAAAGAIILATGGWYWLDPAVALTIALVVAYHAIALTRKVVIRLRPAVADGSRDLSGIDQESSSDATRWRSPDPARQPGGFVC